MVHTQIISTGDDIISFAPSFQGRRINKKTRRDLFYFYSIFTDIWGGGFVNHLIKKDDLSYLTLLQCSIHTIQSH